MCENHKSITGQAKCCKDRKMALQHFLFYQESILDLLQVLSERNSVRKEENQNGKDKKDGIFLSELRARGGKMAWAVSRMQGMEYICRRKENPGKGQYDQRPGKAEPVSLSQIETKGEDRIRTEMEELDRVLGGGIVKALLFWWAGIRESESPRCFCRCAGFWEIRRKISFIFPEKNQQGRLSFGQTDGDFSDRITLLCETNLETIEEVIQRKNRMWQ